MSRLKFLIAFLLLTPAAHAQECPRIEVMCPTEALEQGMPMSFSASVSGGDPTAQFTFNWTVSAGTITSGQGTPSVTLDTTGLGGQIVKVTVEVGGLPQSCASSVSCEAKMAPPPIACWRPFDQYSLEMEFEDEKARLDNFAISLQEYVSVKGFVLVYAGERAGPDAVKLRAKLAWSYLTTKREIDESRLILVYGGYPPYGADPSGSAELWIVPYGADLPFTGQTIKPDEVRATRNDVRKGSRRKG